MNDVQFDCCCATEYDMYGQRDSMPMEDFGRARRLHTERCLRICPIR
jgi:hypothetical protein